MRAVVCGRPGRDAHVGVLQSAMGTMGLAGEAVCVVPIADSASEDLQSHLQTTPAFITAAIAARGSGKVLVCCRQGASRSASVVMAHLMTDRSWSVLEAFRHVAAKRWRLWPNAGFVTQLLRLQPSLKKPKDESSVAAVEQAETLCAIGIHAAWAANRQNLEETGAGRQGLTLEDVRGLWDQAAAAASSVEERFERCKALALGVDLSSFEDDL